MSIAELRTNVTDGRSANGSGDVGPFSLSQSEWKAFSALPEFQLDYEPSDITFWRSQCAVFAVMTYLTQNKLAGLLLPSQRRRNLFLAACGSKAAVVGLHKPGQLLSDLINSTPPADFSSNGVDPKQIIARSPQVLTDNVSIADTMDLVGSELQKSIDNTRQFMVQIGAQSISQSTSTIPKVTGSSAEINFNSPVIKKTGRQDMAKLIAQRFGEAGFATVEQIAAIASAIGKSELDPKAASRPPERSFGLFQLNMAPGARGAGHSEANSRTRTET